MAPHTYLCKHPVIEVEEVGDMDMSQGIFDKYRIVEQVQKISRDNPHAIA